MMQHRQLRLPTSSTTTAVLVMMTLVVLLSIITTTSSVSAFLSTVSPHSKNQMAGATRRLQRHHYIKTTILTDRLFAEKEGQTTSTSTTTIDDTQEISHILRVSKPLGIVIEEIDASQPERGVCIGKISPDGNCCGTTDGALPPPDICVNDKIIGVNGLNCAGLIFEEIMDAIVTSPGDTIELELGRPRGATVVRWPNGVGVAVFVEEGAEYLGNVAIEAGYDDRIEYDCRSGSCGVCSLIVRREDGERRVVKPCVAKVRRGGKKIFVEDDRYHP